MSLDLASIGEPLFAASRAKVERAKTFIAELVKEQERYAAQGVRASIAIDEKGQPQMKLEWDGTGLLPGVILGDAVHNLRSALDLMASELAVIAEQNPDQTYFPFATSLHELRKSHKFKAFAKCGADCVRLLEEIAPYRGGNEALRALHDLDVRDKHRSLIPSENDIQFSFIGDLALDNPWDHTLKPQVEVLCYKFPPDAPLAGEQIVPTLERLTKSVEGILEAFATLIAART